ncbi:hypothetical protein SETIT_3G177900v2 [Setaria italica]|uniref:Uncharacterized protein n=1 Tax=Setaria italica TaxID=4555 RepID=A0A368QI32_SETIT|nr:hypothetical protein SETIT_3G177900v2 [Setaria italica]
MRSRAHGGLLSFPSPLLHPSVPRPMEAMGEESYNFSGLHISCPPPLPPLSACPPFTSPLHFLESRRSVTPQPPCRQHGLAGTVDGGRKSPTIPFPIPTCLFLSPGFDVSALVVAIINLRCFNGDCDAIRTTYF